MRAATLLLLLSCLLFIVFIVAQGETPSTPNENGVAQDDPATLLQPAAENNVHANQVSTDATSFAQQPPNENVAQDDTPTTLQPTTENYANQVTTDDTSYAQQPPNETPPGFIADDNEVPTSLELSDTQFQEVLENSANSSSYVFAKVETTHNTLHATNSP